MPYRLYAKPNKHQMISSHDSEGSEQFVNPKPDNLDPPRVSRWEAPLWEQNKGRVFFNVICGVNFPI